MMLIGRKGRSISILFLVFLILFECISQVPIFADVSSGDIIAYYNFDGNANDSSGNNNNGVPVGNITYTNGFTGQAASFDGNSYIKLPDNLIKSRQLNAFTISLRFKTSSSGTLLGYQNVAPLAGGIGQYVPIIYVGDDGLLHCEFWVYDPSVLPNHGYGLKVPSSSRVDNDQWHSITLTATTTSIEVYMDNVRLGSDTVTNGKYIDHLSMSYNQIGMGYNDTSRPGSSSEGWKYYTGLIDDLYILNKGISQQEVQQLTSDAPNSANINIVNNSSGTNDTITVNQLSEGDIIKVYDAPTGGNVLGTATVPGGQTSVVIPVAQLGSGTGSLYISVTKSGSNESARTQKTYVSEATQAANTSIAAAKSILPASITATEGVQANLLTYLNGLSGMGGTGVTLTLQSNNSSIASDGTITYGPSPVTGDVIIHINKADGTEDTRTISITVPAHVQPSANLVSYYDFAGNLTDSKGNSILTAFSAAGDGIHNNASSSFGTDSQSTTDNSYWQWSSTAPRGGGFQIDVNKNLMTNYSIGIRFLYNETHNNTSSYKKIIDYKDMKSDNGFYFYKTGQLGFFPYTNTGSSVTGNGQVVDLIITRNGSTNEFIAYMVTNGKLVQEFIITDTGSDAIPAVVSGKSRLGFFFDENISKNPETTSGGRVYSIKIWDGPITQLEAQKAMDTGNATTLANGSLGTPGNGAITGLASGTAYQVVADGAKKYVKADGTLSDNEADAAPLSGTQITGLSNGKTYSVQTYTPTPGSSFETVINNIGSTANVNDMKTVLEAKAAALGITVSDSSDYHSLSAQGKTAVAQAVFSGKPFTTVAAIKSAFNSAVAAQKSAEQGASANASIAAAKALLPSSFTATEGSSTNLLSYLNSITGMTGTGVTLTIASNNANVADNGTITYTSSTITGNVVVHINKTDGTEDTRTISVTIPAHSQVADNTTVLSNGSLGTPGNGTITGLASGTAYQVVADGVKKYVKADGTLSDNEADAAPLSGAQITGLSNGKTYSVQTYTPTPGSSFETAINNIGSTANVNDMKTVLEAKAAALGITVSDSSDYHSLSAQGKTAVAQAVFNGKPFTTVAAIKSAFNSAVAAQKSAEQGASANISIAAAKALLPSSFTATEGSSTNLLSYLNSITGMTGTGVTLTIVSNNANVADNGTITYTSSSITGNVVVTINKANGTSESKTISVTIPAHNGSGSNTNTDAASNTATGNASIVINGESTNAAISDTQKDNSGRMTTTVSIDDKKINDLLDKLPTTAGTGEGETPMKPPVVQIPVDTQSDVIIGQLNGQTVKNMQDKNVVLEIKTDDVIYTLPASQINIDAVSNQIGANVELKDIKVKVAISKSSDNTAKIVEDTANRNHYQVVVKPVEFEIQCTNGSRTIEVSSFNGYVERTVAIPDGVDPGRITTGIVLNSDGSFSHKPTKVIKINGKYFAKINSVTNSTYSVIWNPVEFKDVENHWSKEAVDDMGSRLVISGIEDGRFDPEGSITRAEFTKVVVKALGLETQTGRSPFTDVNSDNIYSEYIQTAYNYKLIGGYPDGRFDPMTKITREQAMIIIARAMSLAGLNPGLAIGESNTLLKGFKDYGYTSGYARDSIAACVKTGIVGGINSKSLAPDKNITRAETAQIVRQLLVKSGLI